MRERDSRKGEVIGEKLRKERPGEKIWGSIIWTGNFGGQEGNFTRRTHQGPTGEYWKIYRN